MRKTKNEELVYRRCDECCALMVGVVKGDQPPARVVCSPCGGRPLTSEEREIMRVERAA